MLKIKLFRTGKRNQPRYRIVVVERRSKLGGRYTDLLGYYHPELNPPDIKLDLNKYSNWLKKGAQPTETVKALFTKAGAAVSSPGSKLS